MPLTMRMDFRAEDLIGPLSEMGKQQAPFALSQAINDAALAFQYQERKNMRSVFVLRHAQFILNSVKITHFAKKQPEQLYAIVTIEPPGGQTGAWADFLNKFEDGTTKIPIGGAHLALPIEARASKSDIVPDELRPRALSFSEVATKSGYVQIKGANRTFIVQTSTGSAIMQRTGPGRDGVRRLYSLHDSAPTPASLRFQSIAEAVIPDAVAAALPGRLKAAINTRRGAGGSGFKFR